MVLTHTCFLTMGQIITWDLKSVAHSDKHPENDHPTLQFPSGLQSVSAHCFGVRARNFTILVHSHGSYQPSQAADFI